MNQYKIDVPLPDNREEGDGRHWLLAQKLRRLDPDSWTAQILGGFIGVAALSPLMLQPVLVYAYDVTLGYGPDIAGYISSAGLAGLALASLPVALRARQWCMGRVAVLGMAVMLVFTALILWFRQPSALFFLTFMAGIGGGLAQAAVAAAFARCRYFVRAFAIFTCLQFIYPGVSALFLLRLLNYDDWGVWGGFSGIQFAQLALILPALIVAPVLAAYKLPDNSRLPLADSEIAVKHFLSVPAVLSLLGMFIYGASNGAVFAYSEGIGRLAGLEPDMIGDVLVYVNVAAGIVVLGVIRFGDRINPYFPLIGGILAQLFALVIFFIAPTYAGYLLGMLVFIVAWAVVFQYFLSSQSELDKSGVVVVCGQFTNLIGAVLGPAIAAFFIGAEAAFVRALSVSAILTFLALIPMVIVPVMLWKQRITVLQDPEPQPVMDGDVL
ncbi:MAG: Major facilitator family transporter [Candidatus Tokpelaia hoelldobleri]|uniref:Major facilitator family transporter n=1 Tax=Candidatus Tokpelaia hoelldobleri TaxID=1902579 RepID=A0A1U9JSD0_9HYPH|nr:MAG: Major facilitator family transporter [Candidatus Tokpelaia hoelldoblerii]